MRAHEKWTAVFVRPHGPHRPHKSDVECEMCVRIDGSCDVCVRIVGCASACGRTIRGVRCGMRDVRPHRSGTKIILPYGFGIIEPYHDRMDEQERRSMDAVMANLLGPIPTHQCKGHNKAGGPCGQAPAAGSEVCHLHGGKAPQVIAKAQDRTAHRQAVIDAKKSVLDLTDEELIAQYGNPAETLQWIM